MFLLGVVSMICFIFITRALSMARAAVLAPLQYTSIVWATIIGWLVWRDAPTWPIVLGNAIIVGSGLYLAARDVQWRPGVVAAPIALTPRE
jgi:S-adenosylmethionine uptake transporter